MFYLYKNPADTSSDCRFFCYFVTITVTSNFVLKMKVYFPMLLFLVIISIHHSGYAQDSTSTILFNKAVQFFKAKDYKTADSLFSLSADLEPNPDTYYNLGLAKMKLKKFDEAYLTFKKVKEMDSFYPNPMLYYNIALLAFFKNSTCEYCFNMEEYIMKCDSFTLKHFGADANYNSFISRCFTKTDTIISSNDKSVIRKVVLKNNCDGNEAVTYYLYIDKKLNKKYTFDNLLESITLNLNDSLPLLRSFNSEIPEFPGGEMAMRIFLASNLICPEEVKRLGISGRVYIQFVINSKGMVTDVKVARGVHPLIDAEAQRVVQSMPAWKPGKINGKPVNVSFTVPININF